MPGGFAPCFFRLNVDDALRLGPDPRGGNYSRVVVRQPRCTWDACVETIWQHMPERYGRPPGRCETRWTTKAVLKPPDSRAPASEQDAYRACASSDYRLMDHWRDCRKGTQAFAKKDGCVGKGFS